MKNRQTTKRILALLPLFYGLLFLTNSTAQANNSSSTVTSSTAKSARHSENEHHQEVWIHEAWLDLTENAEQDDFYSGFALEIDFDTVWFEQRIYIRAHLIDADHHETELLISEPFWLFSDSATDRFESETLLKQGFEPGFYDLIIDIYDAESDEWLGYCSKAEQPLFASLALESQEHDFTYDDATPSTERISVTEVEISSHGGALSPYWLLILVSSMAAITRHRQRSAPNNQSSTAGIEHHENG